MQYYVFKFIYPSDITTPILSDTLSIQDFKVDSTDDNLKSNQHKRLQEGFQDEIFIYIIIFWKSQYKSRCNKLS